MAHLQLAFRDLEGRSAAAAPLAPAISPVFVNVDDFMLLNSPVRMEGDGHAHATDR
jgi:hypothetical protein